MTDCYLAVHCFSFRINDIKSLQNLAEQDTPSKNLHSQIQSHILEKLSRESLDRLDVEKAA